MGADTRVVSLLRELKVPLRRLRRIGLKAISDTASDGFPSSVACQL